MPGSLFTAASSAARLFLIACSLFFSLAQPLSAAMTLPESTESALAGLAFDDRPIVLPMSKNFQVAMSATAQELGGYCSSIESFGWRLKPTEQERVNQIFSTTAARLKGLNYLVRPRSPKSVTEDITVFSATRRDKDLLFMWSAGDAGLVLLICDVKQGAAPAAPQTQEASSIPPPALSAASVPMADIPEPSPVPVDEFPKFSPVGEWVGGYTCAQGYTGGTLSITRVNNESVEGTFRFYPTAQNPLVDTGKYYVSGQYDRATKRMLLTPGAWIQHPKDYYDTIMIARFFPDREAVSAVFQGVTGCTSFEGHRGPKTVSNELITPQKKKKTKKSKPKPAEVPVPSASKKEIEKNNAKPESQTEKIPDKKGEIDATSPVGVQLGEQTKAEEKPLAAPVPELPSAATVSTKTETIETPSIASPIEVKPADPVSIPSSQSTEGQAKTAMPSPAKGTTEQAKENPAASPAGGGATKSVEDVLKPPADLPPPPKLEDLPVVTTPGK